MVYERGGGVYERGGGRGVESGETIVRFTKSVYKRTTRPPFVHQPKGMAMVWWLFQISLFRF